MPLTHKPLAHSTELSWSWFGNSAPFTKPKVPFSCSPLGPILNYPSSAHILTAYFFQILFNIVLSTPTWSGLFHAPHPPLLDLTTLITFLQPPTSSLSLSCRDADLRTG